MHKVPDTVEQHILGLIADASNGQIRPTSISRNESVEPISLHPNAYSTEAVLLGESPADKSRNMSITLDFKDNAHTSPKDVMAAIQAGLGKVPVFAEQFNGLKPKELESAVPVKKALEEFTAKFTAAADASQGLTELELEALRKWQGTKDSWSAVGARVTSDTSLPVEVTFGFKDKSDADAAKANLDGRVEAIRAKIIEQAGPHLDDAQKQELAKLRVDVIEHKEADWDSSIQLRIGIPNEEAETGPDGKKPLKISPLNDLMTRQAKEGSEASIGGNLLRYAVTYGDNKDGDKWLEALQFASGEQLKSFFSFRAEHIQDETQKAALGELLKNDSFLSHEEIDKRRKENESKADFTLMPPNDRHPGYRLDLTLPEGMTAAKVYESIAATAPQKDWSDHKALAAEAVWKALDAKILDTAGSVIPVVDTQVGPGMGDGGKADGSSQQTLAISVATTGGDSLKQERIKDAMLATLATVESLKGLEVRPSSWREENGVTLTYSLKPGSTAEDMEAITKEITATLGKAPEAAPASSSPASSSKVAVMPPPAQTWGELAVNQKTAAASGQQQVA